ncbi:MAG TPA: glycosyltransferase family 2 protein [Candidatus Sulfotelmatobacter sp.]|nr:glycosyltransferase family 2 protein [Candidatus Sulfotelmatobacter sp.]
MAHAKSLVPYVLITPACNEEKFIEFSLKSVVKQSVLPVKWVIVNDGSSDATGSIAEGYARKYDWIELVNLPTKAGRNFAAKVHAFNAGRERLQELEYDVIGNLDADVTLDEDHFEFLVGKFRQDPTLGVAGTIFIEADGYSSGVDSFEGQNYVSGQCQMFRRECFDEIGGYLPSKNGGIDWIAVMTARMIGWKTRSFREKSFFHHRVLGTADCGVVGSSYAYGRKDYYLGGHPLWELFRSVYRLTKKPYVLAGVALFLGYMGAYIKHEERAVSKALMDFHRKEQMRRLRRILGSLFTFKQIDRFELMPVEQPTRSVSPQK